MKLFSLAVVLILLFADTTAADFLKPRWKVSVKDDVYTITFNKGKGGFMQGELPMKTGEYATDVFVHSGKTNIFQVSGNVMSRKYGTCEAQTYKVGNDNVFGTVFKY